MTWYLRVLWEHDLPNEPIDLYSEVDEDGYETRKVEIYRDGRRDYADESSHTGTTMLSDVPIGTVDDIADQPEFTPTRISQEDFDAVWLSTQHG